MLRMLRIYAMKRGRIRGRERKKEREREGDKRE